VGVSWYEAYAFTRWLTLERNDGHKYSLLSENQWQAAAAGFDGRKYPWGDKWDKNKCNSRESKIGKISPVGVFKRGNTPEGVVDLSGNVWEWTQSDYRTKKELSDFAFDAEVQKLWNEKKLQNI
jgi:formylglycine-generating enzyme required for sulfatase activity